MTLGLLIKVNVMNFRLITMMTAVLVTTAGSGCSGMRNFLFGRGAACGANCATPGYVEPGCGHEIACGTEVGCGTELGCGHEPAPAPHGFGGCGLLKGLGICKGSDACGCGNHGSGSGYYSGYAPMGSDPYARYEGEVVGSEVIGETYGGYPGPVVREGIVGETVLPGTTIVPGTSGSTMFLPGTVIPGTSGSTIAPGTISPGMSGPSVIVPGTTSKDNFGARSGERIIGVDPQPVAPPK